MSEPISAYCKGFAEFYNAHGTAWTKEFATGLLTHLGPGHVPKKMLDLACGTGVSTEIFVNNGWTVTGIDVSAAMLAVAEKRLAENLTAGQTRLVQANMTEFSLDTPVSVCVCLEGALNHLSTVAELSRCVGNVYNALEPDGLFVFDLYEAGHFRGWHNLTVFDHDDAVIIKRGVWDDTSGVGMLRISGLYTTCGANYRVDQTVTSRVFTYTEVVDLLLVNGFQLAEQVTIPIPSCTCGQAGVECRRVYVARR